MKAVSSWPHVLLLLFSLYVLDPLLATKRTLKMFSFSALVCKCE